MRAFVLAAAILAAGCQSQPVGINGKTADQVSVEGDFNRCDPADRLGANPLDAPSQTVTTELQRVPFNCRPAAPRTLLKEEPAAK